MMENFLSKSRVLAIGAHPDDIEIGCGGTLAQMAQTGSEIFTACFTSGEQGNHMIASHELSLIREGEALASAKILGFRKVDFLRYPDGVMSADHHMKQAIIQLIRRIRPDYILTHASTDLNTDHRVCGDVVRSAVEGASGPWFPEAGEPFRVKIVLGFEVWDPLPRPQTYVNIENVLELKLTALAEHRSQLKHINYPEIVKGLAGYRGQTSGVGAFAEAFEVWQVEATCLLS